MDFFNEVVELIDLPLEQANKFKYMVIGDKYLYVAGHKGIKSIDESNVIFFVGKSFLSVTGEGLSLKHLSADDAIICGTINSTSLIK